MDATDPLASAVAAQGIEPAAGESNASDPGPELLSPQNPPASRSGEYEGLNGTFADACREADRQYREQQAGRPHESRAQPRLAESTRQAIDWMLKHGDAARCDEFVRGRPGAERYVMERRGRG
jgi:hypothetical protein